MSKVILSLYGLGSKSCCIKVVCDYIRWQMLFKLAFLMHIQGAHETELNESECITANTINERLKILIMLQYFEISAPNSSNIGRT